MILRAHAPNSLLRASDWEYFAMISNNRKLVLDALRRHPWCTSAELGLYTGLTRGNAVRSARELIEMGQATRRSNGNGFAYGCSTAAAAAEPARARSSGPVHRSNGKQHDGGLPRNYSGSHQPAAAPPPVTIDATPIDGVWQPVEEPFNPAPAHQQFTGATIHQTPAPARGTAVALRRSNADASPPGGYAVNQGYAPNRDYGESDFNAYNLQEQNARSIAVIDHGKAAREAAAADMLRLKQATGFAALRVLRSAPTIESRYAEQQERIASAPPPREPSRRAPQKSKNGDWPQDPDADRGWRQGGPAPSTDYRYAAPTPAKPSAATAVREAPRPSKVQGLLRAERQRQEPPQEPKTRWQQWTCTPAKTTWK